MGRRLPPILIALALSATAAAGAEPAACAPAAHPGGEWPLYGQDHRNSRAQPLEQTIGVAEAGGLEAAKVFSAAAVGGEGFFQSTPVIAGGCLYAATDGGDVYALNADTLEVVWSARFRVAETRLGGVVAGAVTVEDDLAFVAVSDAGKPFVAALDRLTGAERWRTVIDTRPGSFGNASPVPFGDGMLFAGFAGDEYLDGARGGYAILRRSDGAILRKSYTIPDADYEAGYWGGSIWATAVYEPGMRALFVGSGNPASHAREHEYTNALLKIDADPQSPTFGAIVDAYKGNVDQYYPGLDRQPVCTLAPDVEYGDAWSATCLQLDLDFGASPNLFPNARGKLLVGALQKSGIYHAVYADTMLHAFTTMVGTPCFFCNAASTAAAEGRIFAAGTEPGQLVAFDGDLGGYQWVQPLADAIHYQSVSVANGVTYLTDLYGNLNAFDAATGMPLLKRGMSSDVGGASVGGIGSAGVSVARNTVYAPAGAYVVAYR